MVKATKATKAAVAPIVSKAGPTEQVYVASGEQSVPLDKVKVVWENLNRPGFDVKRTPVVDLQREWQTAGGQLNPCLVSDNGDGTFNLLGGYRRFRCATLETEAGRHNGTLLVKVVAPAPGVTLDAASFAALLNFKENNNGALPTGIEGRVASFAALVGMGWTQQQVSRYCGGVAVDVINDSLHLAAHPRLLAAVRAFEAGESTFDETTPAKDGKGEPTVKTFPSGPFSVARHVVRKADEWAKDTKEAKEKGTFTMWQAWTRVCHMRTVDAVEALKVLRKGEDAYKAFQLAKNTPKVAPAAPVTSSSGTPDATPTVTVLPPAPAPKDGVRPTPLAAPLATNSGLNIRQDTATEDAVRAAGAKALAPAYAALRKCLSVDKPSAATVAEALDLLNALSKAAEGAFTTATWGKACERAAAALADE